MVRLSAILWQQLEELWIAYMDVKCEYQRTLDVSLDVAVDVALEVAVGVAVEVVAASVEVA